MTRTVGDLLAEQLGLLGATRAFTASAPPGLGTALEIVVTDDDDQALVLADASGRLSSGVGAAFVTGPILHLSNQPGGRATPISVDDPHDLVDALAVVGGVAEPCTVAVHLALDLAAPAPDGLGARVDRPSQVAVTLHESFADAEVAVVVGPGVVRGGHVEALREMAMRGGLAVVNTWGAKGVFRWDSPFHAGTAGLQARDFELAGVSSADVVITCGLDPAETPVERLGSYVVQDVAGWQLPVLVSNWPQPSGPPEQRPALYAALAAVVTPMYESTAVPIAPPRAALHLAGACPPGGVVVADAGLAGFWIARTLPTSEAGSVVVPAIAQPGFAVAGAIAARLAGRPAVAVVEGPLDDETERLLELAERAGLSFGVQVWGDRDTVAAPRSVDDHVELTRRGFDGAELRIDDVAIDVDGLDDLVDVAGPIVAWGLSES